MILLWLSLAFAGDSLEDLLAEVGAHDAMVGAMAGLQAASLRERAHTPWRDPTLSVEVSNAPIDSLDLGAHPMAGVQVRGALPLPRAGQAAAGRDEAQAEGAVALARAGGVRSELTLAIETAWWQLTLVRQHMQITARHLERTDNLLGAVQARYEVGGIGQHALLRLQVRRDQLGELAEDLRASETALLADLTLLVNRQVEPDTPLDLQPVPPPPDTAPWAARVDNNPRLAGQRGAVARSMAAAEVARRTGRPQATVWAGYRVRVQADPDGVDQVSVGVGVPLPLTAPPAAKARAGAALSDARGLELSAMAMRRDIVASLTRHHVMWQRAFDSAQLHATTLLPGTERARDATLADFRSGIAEFAALYDAEVATLDVERLLRSRIVATHIHRAEVRALLGGENP